MKRPHFLALTAVWILAGSAFVTAQAPLALKNLAIPESLGKVDQRFDAGDSRWIIHIQDVHAHALAQENIAAIIEHIQALYGVTTVAIEGGWGETDFPETRKITSSRGKQAIARRLLEESYITGPAYASMFAKQPINLIGVEDQDLYQKNRKTYLQFLGRRADTDAKLKIAWDQLITEKAATYSDELLAFDQSLLGYRRGENFKDFIPHILNVSGIHDLDLTGFDQIDLFIRIQDADFKINKTRLKSDAKRLMDKYPGTKMSFEELLRSGQIPSESFQYYPAAIQYLDMIQLQDQLHYLRYFEQLEEVIKLIKVRLLETAEQEALDQKSERLLIAEKLLHLHATPGDYKNYVAQSSQFEIELGDAGLADALAVAKEFYETANRRDEIFFEKINGDPRLTGDIVLVTGGFHTEALSRRFEADGISYLTITPDLGGEAPKEELYYQRLRENVQSALSENQNANFLIDRLIPPAVQEYDRSRNITKALQVATAFWKPLDTAVPGGTSVAGLLTTPKKENFISMEDFLKLSPAEQRVKIKEWITLVQTSKLRIGYAAMQENGFVRESDLALDILETIKQNRFNTLFWVYQKMIHDLSIGGKASIHRVQASSIAEAAAEPPVQRKMKSLIEKDLLAAVALEEQLEDSGFRVFPPGDITLLLVRPILEGHLGLSEDAAVQAQFYETIHNLLAQYETLAEILQSA